MSDDRPMVYAEGDSWVYLASSIGRSIRCLAAARQGYEPLPAPDFLIRAAEAGTALEPVVVAILEQRGYQITDRQATVELQPFEGVIVRGHLDAGFVIDLNGWGSMLEVKTMSGGGYADL